MSLGRSCVVPILISCSLLFGGPGGNGIDGALCDATAPCPVAPRSGWTMDPHRQHQAPPEECLWPWPASSVLREPLDVEVEVIARELNAPSALTLVPGGMILVAEQNGDILGLDLSSGELSALGRVTGPGDRVVDMVLQPRYPRPPFLLVATVYSDASGIKVMRVTRTLFEAGVLAEGLTLVGAIPAGGGNHNGGALAVDRNGLVYLSTGDNGHPSRAQDPHALEGKVLRFTEDGRPAPGNPYGTQVWTLGHRNPQGLALLDGSVISVEHGPDRGDELNALFTGGNYGWPVATGLCDTAEERLTCAASGLSEPVVEFSPAIGVSKVAVSQSQPGRSSVFVTALAGQALIRLTCDPLNSLTVVEPLIVGTFGRLRGIAVGRNGVVYVSTSNRDPLGVARPGDDRLLRVTLR